MTVTRVSRRSWLALAGSGVALASLAAVWRRRAAAAAEEAAQPADREARLVDHDGWIVTPEDRQALAGRDPR